MWRATPRPSANTVAQKPAGTVMPAASGSQPATAASARPAAQLMPARQTSSNERRDMDGLLDGEPNQVRAVDRGEQLARRGRADGHGVAGIGGASRPHGVIDRETADHFRVA